MTEAEKDTKPARKKPGPKTENGPTALLDSKGIDWVCEQLCDGVPQRHIASNLGIGIATLSRWIAADLERSARVREARIAAARTFDEMAEQEIREASDPFTLARARELAFHLRWKASKFAPRDFGDKLEIEQRTTITDLTDEQLDAKLARLTQQSAEAGATDAAGGKGQA